MAARTYNALFLCTGNSARSILAEAILHRLGETGLPIESLDPVVLEARLQEIGKTAVPAGDDI